MPMRARKRGRLVSGAPTDTPSTKISPFWKGSSPLTVFISVDLPEPEGPQTTTTSPCATWVLQSSSTCVAPYHLLTCFISIIPVPAIRIQICVHDNAGGKGAGPEIGRASCRERGCREGEIW